MAIAERSATTAWDGDLAHGDGTLNGASGALADLSVTWASRTERSNGKTSPEELIAAAHSSCFAMALSQAAGKDCPISRALTGVDISVNATLA
jgi:osmotically inducible protein OsmC